MIFSCRFSIDRFKTWILSSAGFAGNLLVLYPVLGAENESLHLPSHSPSDVTGPLSDELWDM